MEGPLNKTIASLAAITVMLCLLPTVYSCHNTVNYHATKLKKVVKRPYDRPKITRRGNCTQLDSDVLPIHCSQMNENGMTYFPNVLRHYYPAEANVDFQNLWGWIHANCSSDMDLFLCGTHYPQCRKPNSKKPRMLLPCRSLCEKVRDGCAPPIRKYLGYSWPPPFKCDLFPVGDNCLKEREPSTANVGDRESLNRHSAVTPQTVQTTTAKPREKNQVEIGVGDANVTRMCENSTRRTKPEGVDPNETPNADREKPSACVKGHFKCRLSSVKSYLNGVAHCCFYRKQIVHKVKVNSGNGKLESSCICSYESPNSYDSC